MRKLLTAVVVFFVGGVFVLSCAKPGFDRPVDRAMQGETGYGEEQGGYYSDTSETVYELDRLNQNPIAISDSADSGVEDVSVAIDDYVWRQLGLAAEYCSMGVLANRETAWEEAEYYFEKCLALLGELDIVTETDSLSEESAKYNRILAEVVANYKETLVSLGRLSSDVSPDVLVSRFSEINNIKVDTTELKRLSAYEQEKVTYNVPIVFNERVKECILYYQTVARDAVVRYLGRSTKYLPMIFKILQEYGLPTDIAYLALVESGFNPHAYSWARAMGMWQFIASTGRLYNMERTWWYDERKDPVKSTHAAARFLKDLYNEFGSWELAMAAYNGGPQRIRNEINKQRTKDFWKMRLKKQTMDYVPFFMAAVMICKDPIRFGFTDVVYEPEWVYDEVRIEKSLDLKTVAQSLGCPVATLQELNPELLRNFTPPNLKYYNLRIPRGTKEKFYAVYDELPVAQQTNYVKHKVRKGETLSAIARKYGISEYAIMEANRISRKSKLAAGKTLIIPVPTDDRSYASSEDRSYDSEGDLYVVRKGDTVSEIAKAFGTTAAEIRRLNGLERQAKIYVGQKLRVRPGGSTLTSSSKSSKTGSDFYIVRKGDTLWDIARRLGLTINNLLRLNNLDAKSRIYPGQKLLISQKERYDDEDGVEKNRKDDAIFRGMKKGFSEEMG
jgi:membrane-bound lytic murein transglycosylase D